MKALSSEDASRRRSGIFSEKRIFVKTDAGTRFVRLRGREQVLAVAGCTLLVGWAVAATALLTVQAVEGKASREQAVADRAVYETRVNALAADRDRRHQEALAAQERFATLLSQLSTLQGRIFDAELAAKERSDEVAVLRDQLASAQAALDVQSRAHTGAGDGSSDAALALVTGALSDMSEERSQLTARLAETEESLTDLELTLRLEDEKNDRIFKTLEDAVTVSVEPLDNLFAKLGINSDRLLDTLRDRHDGQGGPLEPIAFSSMGGPDEDAARANNILTHMKTLSLYRMAVDALPIAMPVEGKVRQTSGFGYRRDPILGRSRMHEGVDWSGPYGTPIMATADGVVLKAGRNVGSGYGNAIVIRHEFGIETLYAHLSKINVKPGQKVSKGERIGAMGNSGRSTGTHLHYEVHVGGKPTNPLTYITAARNVF